MDTQEVSFDAIQAADACKKDLDFLAATAIPETYRFSFPPVLVAVWGWLLKCANSTRAFPKLALGLPRGFAKTTLIKLFILYVILFTKRQYILIVCASANLAENILADVIDMLDHPNIKLIFGDWKLGIDKDTQSFKTFGFRGRNIIFHAAGAGTAIRGTTRKNERPDVMIFDDIQTREQAESEIESLKLENWMFGTAMKAKSPFGCMYIFIGNMYPTKWSILKKLKHNPSWTSFIVGGILETGASLWEELHPLEQLLEEYESDLAAGHPEIFYSEVLNDENASLNNLLDISSLPPLPVDEKDIPEAKCIIIDPATDKSNADYVSIGYFEYYDSRAILCDLEEGRFSPLETIRKAVTLALKYNCRVVGIEGTAYQSTLAFWFDYVCKQFGIFGVDAVEIYPGTTNKNSRILTMFKSYQKGELFVIPPLRPRVHAQALGFNPLKRDNEDGILDLLTYAPKMLQEYGSQMMIDNQILMQENNAIVVRNAIECSPF